MASTYDMAGAARQRGAFLSEQLVQLRAEAARYDIEIERLNTLYTRNRQEAASYLLGEVTDGELRALEQRLGYPRLIQMKRASEKRLAQAQAELAELMQDQEAAHNEFYMSQLKDEQDEIREVYTRVSAEVGVWRSNEHFIALEARGFFSPNYDSGFFGWAKDWRDVSLLMEGLEEAHEGRFYPNPDAVRTAWLELWKEAEPVLELWATLSEREEQLLRLGRKRALLEQAPTRLFQELYAELSAAIIAHIDALPDNAKVALVVGDKHLATFLQKDVGLLKQSQYLAELRLRRLDPSIKQLESDISRLNMKVSKYERKYKYVPDADVEKMRTVKAESWQKRHARNAQMRERIGGFNKYQRGSFTRDYLWWDAMTGGAPADDIYEVRVFRTSYPHFNHRDYDPSWDDGWQAPRAMDDAADALADSLAAGGDDLLLGDVS